jgi:OmpR-family two-component system manganese-sensing response regulator
MAKILMVDDDVELAKKVKRWLSDDGNLIETSPTGEDGLQLLENFGYDLVLLDWQLPGISGIEVCRRYRNAGGTAFVIFLTGRAQIQDKEFGFDAGGDDYLCKPFELRELSARVKAVLRRPQGLLPTELTIKGVNLNLSDNSVTVNGASFRLMPKEAALLEFLMRHPNRMFGSKELLSAVWESDRDTSAVTVRSWMRNLRQKLSSVNKGDFIKTVSGLGYMVEFDADATGDDIHEQYLGQASNQEDNQEEDSPEKTDLRSR